MIFMLFLMVVIALLTMLVVDDSRQAGKTGNVWAVIGVLSVIMTYFIFR